MRRRCCDPPRFGLGAVAIMSVWFVAAGCPALAAERRTITLPKETAALKPSPLPGYRLAKIKCGICHSADYINLQPPAMTFAQWAAEVVKMQHAYGAPIDDAELAPLAAYLSSSYGDARSVPADAAGTQAPQPRGNTGK